MQVAVLQAINAICGARRIGRSGSLSTGPVAWRVSFCPQVIDLNHEKELETDTQVKRRQSPLYWRLPDGRDGAVLNQIWLNGRFLEIVRLLLTGARDCSDSRLQSTSQR